VSKLPEIIPVPLPSLLPEEIPVMPAWYRRRLLEELSYPPAYGTLGPLEIHRGRRVRFIQRIGTYYDDVWGLAIRVVDRDGKTLAKHVVGSDGPCSPEYARVIAPLSVDALWEWYWLSDFAQMSDAEIRERNALDLESEITERERAWALPTKGF